MATLRFPLQSSRILAVLLALLHFFALFSAAASLEGWPLVLVEAGVGLSAVGAIGEALQRWPDSALELELHEDGRAAWRDRRGIWHEGKLRNSSYVSSWLLIVALAVPEATRERCASERAQRTRRNAPASLCSCAGTAASPATRERCASERAQRTCRNALAYLCSFLGKAASPAPRRLLVLLSDAASPEDLRKLRVWLRWRSVVSQNTRDAQ